MHPMVSIGLLAGAVWLAHRMQRDGADEPPVEVGAAYAGALRELAALVADYRATAREGISRWWLETKHRSYDVPPELPFGPLGEPDPPTLAQAYGVMYESIADAAAATRATVPVPPTPEVLVNVLRTGPSERSLSDLTAFVAQARATLDAVRQQRPMIVAIGRELAPVPPAV